MRKSYINKYQPITPNAQGWLWSETLGFFLGIHERQLRYFSLEGALLPTPQEAAKNEIVKVKQATQAANQATQAANQAIEVAEQERQIANQATAKLQDLQEKMRSLGISID
jgi:hypothetical protein